MFGLYLGSYDSIAEWVISIILYDWICVFGRILFTWVSERKTTKKHHRNPILSAPATRIVMEFSSSSKDLLSLGIYCKTPNLEVFAWMSRKKKISQQERVFAQLQDQLQLRHLGGDFGRILEEDSLGWCTKKDLLRPQINHIHVAGLPKPRNSGKYNNHLFIFKL